MNHKLKRDQIPPKQAENWRESFNNEKAITFNLKVPQIILQKDTYKLLAGENENRIRIYLGIEQNATNEKYELCAFAVSAFLLGSGDVYADYETPVFKLEKKNLNYSDKTEFVIESIRRYRKWRDGEINSDEEGAEFRKYIYPTAYLLTKYELHEIFVMQNKTEAQIEFGISKTMEVMVNPTVKENRAVNDQEEVFNWGQLCPPYCDERSIYNS